MKNGTVTDKLQIQERELNAPKQDFAGEKKKETEDVQIVRYADKQEDLTENKFANKQEDNLSNNTESKQDSNPTDLGLSSVFGVFTPYTNNREEEQLPVKKKKKKPKRGFRR